MFKIMTCLVFLMFTFSGSAKAFSADKIKSVDVIIEMSHNGDLYLNGSTASLSQLKHFFEIEPASTETSVFVHVDQSVQSKDVLRVMEICCNYKYHSVRLIYQPIFIEKS